MRRQTHLPDVQIHLLKNCSSFSCTWGLASADCIWSTCLSVHLKPPWPDGLLFISCWIFVSSVVVVCYLDVLKWLPHIMLASFCCAWLVWFASIATVFCWTLWTVLFWWTMLPLPLNIIECCVPVHCCWQSVWLVHVIFHGPCFLLSFIFEWEVVLRHLWRLLHPRNCCVGHPWN